MRASILAPRLTREDLGELRKCQAREEVRRAMALLVREHKLAPHPRKNIAHACAGKQVIAVAIGVAKAIAGNF